jgi:tetratricopeptide (TPR) repeat protein
VTAAAVVRVLLLTLCVLAWPCLAQAAGDATERVLEAERAERRGEVAAALEAYRDAVRAAPGSRWARRAQIRLDWLEPRVAEAGVEAVAALLRMRSLAGSELTGQELEELGRGIDLLPRGTVRRESRALLAGAWERLGDTERALAGYRAWLEEPELDAADRRTAAGGAARCLEAHGDRKGALEMLRRAGQAGTPEERRLLLERFGAVARPISVLLLALFALAAVLLARRGWSPAALGRAFDPQALGIMLWLLGVPVAIAALHSPEILHGVGVAVLSLAPVLACAALAGAALDAAGTSRRARSALALLGLGALVAGLYLGLDRSGTLLGLALDSRART